MKSFKDKENQRIKTPLENLELNLDKIIIDLEIKRIIGDLREASENFSESENKKDLLKEKGE